MEKNKESIGPSLLGRLLRYEPETGHLFWVEHPWSKLKNGSRADIQGSRGYRIVCCKGKQYGAHRIAFLISTGKMPFLVDHINGIRSDNRIENLREVDYVINAKHRPNPTPGWRKRILPEQRNVQV